MCNGIQLWARTRDSALSYIRLNIQDVSIKARNSTITNNFRNCPVKRLASRTTYSTTPVRPLPTGSRSTRFPLSTLGDKYATASSPQNVQSMLEKYALSTLAHCFSTTRRYHLNRRTSRSTDQRMYVFRFPTALGSPQIPTQHIQTTLHRTSFPQHSAYWEVQDRITRGPNQIH